MSIIAQLAVTFGGIIVSYLLLGVRRIGNDRVGIVEKRLSLRGSVERGLIARDGEAGFQPKLLRAASTGWRRSCTGSTGPPS
jgi:hypothetical protein